MKASTHRAITKTAAYALGLRGGPVLDALLRGSVDPDKYPEEEISTKIGRGGRIYLVKRRVRHHTTANRSQVMRIIWAARKMYLNGRTVQAAYILGKALHYLQDMYVPRWNHAGIESEIKSLPVPFNEVREAAWNTPCSPSFVKKILKNARPMKAAVAMFEASRATASVVAAVFGPRQPPYRLLKAEEAERGAHRMRMLATALCAAAFTLSTIFAPAPATLIMLAAVAASYMMDGKYRKIRRELEWFTPPNR